MRIDDTPLNSSLLLEAMRGRPRVLVYAFVLAHAVMMALAMLLAQASPPREVIEALAIGRETVLGTAYQAPFTGWVLRAVWWLGDGELWPVVLVGAIADAVGLWAVFQLSRSIVGYRQGAVATGLLAGVAWVTWLLPAPDPNRLLLALFPLTALHLWRAAGRGRRLYWILVAIDVAMLVMTRYAAVVLVGVLIAAMLLSAKGRAAFRKPEPYGAALLAILLLAPHLTWLAARPTFPLTATVVDLTALLAPWGKTMLLALVGHLGLVMLIALAIVPRAAERETVTQFPRGEVDVAARRYVAMLALAPAPAMVIVDLALKVPPGASALVPLFAFSGLGAVLLLGATIPLYRHALVGRTLVALTLIPPVLAIVLAYVQPFMPGPGSDTNWPSRAIAAWFTDIHRTRTGRPIAYVAGDVWTAGTLALASRDRPHLYLEGDPVRAPWISEAAAARAGVLLVWRIEGTAVQPPAGLRARFPDMVLEAPHVFEWAIAGRLAPIQIGWALVPPRPDK